MTPDLAELEAIEDEANSDLWRAAPADVRSSYHVEVTRVGTATCLGCRRLQPALVFRRVSGLGIERPSSEAELDAALSVMEKAGESHSVHLFPDARPPLLPAWLEARGFVRGYSWMKFWRETAQPPEEPTELRARFVTAQESSHFGRLVATGFELPSDVARWFAAIVGRSGWSCAVVYDGGDPVAAGAVYVARGYAWLGMGTTLPASRRRGAHAALLALRVREAAAQGARFAVTETGERVPGKPSHSYRNILRAGFHEAYLQTNFVRAPTLVGGSFSD